MYLTNLQEPDYLEKVFKDNNLLNEEIYRTKGYILTKLSSSGFSPDLGFLLENLSEYNIQFIIDNYKLNREQKEKIVLFLNDSSESENKITLNLSREEVEKYLKDEKRLPENTIFSLEQINNFQKEIKAQYDIENNHIEKIIQKSFNRFSIEDYFKIDKKFLKTRIYLMDVYSFLSDKNYKKLYKDLVLSSNAYSINDFRNYFFEKDEKKLLLKVLNATSTWGIASYQEMKGIRGFSSLLKADEYFELFNSKSLKDYSDSDVEIKKGFIQSVWLSKEVDSYDIINELLRKDCSLKQFITIIDKDFILKLVNKSNLNRILANVNLEREEVAAKYFHIANHFLDMFANEHILENGKTVSSQISFYEMSRLIADIKESKYSYNNQEHPDYAVLTSVNELNIEKIFTKLIPQNFKNNGINNLIKDSKYILKKDTVDSLKSIADKDSNINMFFWLLSSHCDWAKERNYSQENISEQLERYIRQIHKNILSSKDNVTEQEFNNKVSATLMILNGLSSTQLIEDLKTNHNIQNIKPLDKLSKDENIFFSYEDTGLASIDENLWILISQLRPSFYEEIIKQKKLAPDSFVYFCLSRSSDPIQKSFLINYVKLHQAEIEKNENILSSFLSNPNQKEIFPKLTNEKEIYKDLFIIIQRIKLIGEEKDSIKDLKEMGGRNIYSRKELNLPEIETGSFDESVLFDYKNADKLGIQTRFVDLYNKENSLNKEVSKLKGKLSFGFMQEKFKDLIEKRDFKQIYLLEKERMLLDHNDLLVDFINNCRYEELINFFKDKDFSALFKSQIGYENITGIKLNKFSDEENEKIAKILMNIFVDDKKKTFYFFAENNRKFIKNFVINNMPEEIFYSYSFLVETAETYKPTNFVNEPYTNEEIYKAFKNLDNGKGFFSNTDVNSRINTFFSVTFGTSMYAQDKDKRSDIQKKSLARYLNFLDFAKQKDLKLYVLAAHSDCFINNLGWGGKDESGESNTRDKVIHNFFLKHFDLDLILKGMKQIIDEMKQKNGGNFNTNNAVGAIQSIIFNTYYDTFDKQSRSVYHSNMSQEDTKKLFTFLFNEAPMICVERHKIGAALDPKKFFKDNIQDIVNINNIENFLYPDIRVMPQYFNVSEKNDQQERLLSFFTSIVNNALETKESATLEYLLHLLKQKEFISKELSYGALLKLNKKSEKYSSDIFMETIGGNEDVKKLLGTLIFTNKLNSSLHEDVVKEVKLKRNKI